MVSRLVVQSHIGYLFRMFFLGDLDHALNAKFLIQRLDRPMALF